MTKPNKLLSAYMMACVLAVLLSGCAIFKGWRAGEAEWMQVQIPDNYDYDKAFGTVLDVLTEKYEMGVVEKDEGYARTSWSFYRKSNGKNDKRTRSRVTLKFSHDRKSLSVKTEVQVLYKHHWRDGYSDVFSLWTRDEIQNALR